MTTLGWTLIGFVAGCFVGIVGYALYTMIQNMDIPEHKEEI